jgi:transposase
MTGLRFAPTSSSSWRRRSRPATSWRSTLSPRKAAGIRRAIAAAGASLFYLPPYSPDLNPIEQVFAKLKALLRNAAARTRDELCSLSGRLLETCPPAECANYSAIATMVRPKVKML